MVLLHAFCNPEIKNTNARPAPQAGRLQSNECLSANRINQRISRCNRKRRPSIIGCENELPVHIFKTRVALDQFLKQQ